MKICFVSAQYLPTVGGVERYTANLSVELRQRGHNITVVTSSLKGLSAQEIDDNGIEIIRLPSWNFLNGRFPIAHITLKNVQHLKNILQDADWVVIQTRLYPLCIMAIKICQQLKKKAIIIEHGSGHVELRNRWVSKIVEWYEHCCMRYISNGNHFYAVSQASLKWLEHFDIKGEGVLYNAVDFKFIESCCEASDQQILDKYCLSKDKPTVFFAGRLVKEKGIMELIEAVQRLESEFDVQLVIAGSGDLEQTIAAMKMPSIHLLGSLDQISLFKLFSLGGIFCLPTAYSEGMPTSVLEAAACGCFIITTNRGGSKEFILSNKYGIVMENNEVDNVYHSLREALMNPEECKKCAQNAKQRVKNSFSFVTTADALESIFQSLES